MRFAMIVLASAMATGHMPEPADQAQNAASYRLAAVQVTGASRYSRDDVARLSGLNAGQPVTIAQVNSAAQRLAATGLFKAVKYRYVNVGERMTAVFEIEEADWTVPVIFDNFVWFKDEEIVDAVKRDVPTFDGTLPPAEGVPDLVLRSLQTLLDAKRIPGRAAFQPHTDLKEKKLSYLFKVENPAPTLCALAFTGVSAAPERELVNASRSAIGGEYSRTILTGMSAGTLLDVFHRRGHWRASFAPPIPALDSRECVGVSAALAVNEGSVYAFAKSAWTGNRVLDAAALDALLAMKPGEVADSYKIEAGLVQIRRAYAKNGYLMATTSSAPRLDDTSKRAEFEMKVEEGPQFTMGSLEFAGLAEADVNRLRKNWKLPAGVPYDSTYANLYVTNEVVPLLPPGTRRPTAKEAVDPDKHVVDVSIVFER
jgi:outer membrane protein assembly factor BamA